MSKKKLSYGEKIALLAGMDGNNDDFPEDVDEGKEGLNNMQKFTSIIQCIEESMKDGVSYGLFNFYSI
jgi:hypothetical protein